MLLETFYKVQIKTLCTGAHKRILMHEGLRREFFVIDFLAYLDCTKHNEIKIIFFPCQKNMNTLENSTNNIHNLSTEQPKIIRIEE